MRKIDIRSLCLTGTCHTSQPGQDWVSTRSRGGVCVAAVADGAGSCRRAAEGSRAAADAAAEYWMNNRSFLRRLDPDEIASLTMTVVGFRLDQTVKELGGTKQDYCSTLVMCLADKDRRELMTLHVGDGSIYERSPQGLRCISAPENGLTLRETYFAGQPGSCEHCRVERRPLIHDVILCSDGLDRAFRENAGLMARFTELLSASPQSHRDLMDTVSLRDDTSYAALLV